MWNMIENVVMFQLEPAWQFQGKNGNNVQSVYDAQLMAAAAAWRIHKQIYRFTPGNAGYAHEAEWRQ